MTSSDTDLSGSHSYPESSAQHLLNQPNHNSTMSATTVYPPHSLPASTFDHNPSISSRLYRRPSQPGLPIYSNPCTHVPASSTSNVSDQQIVFETPPRNNTGPLPSSVQQYPVGMRQAQTVRTNTSVPVSRTPSQPHSRSASFSNPASPIDSTPHLDIVCHPVTDIVTMLASKLQNLITSNDRIKHSSSSSLARINNFTASTVSTSNRSDPRLLSFHARNIPSITITAYLNRILKYCPTDPEVFVSVLVYFDRILRIANRRALPIFGSYFVSHDVSITPPLVHNSSPGAMYDDDSFTIDSFNVHRLVITTITVATKFFSDQFYTNSRYARVGGLPLAELNHLEIQFLILLDFNLMIPPAEIQFYADHLLRFYIMEQQRQVDKSFMGIVPPPPAPSNLDYKSPGTPITPHPFFSPSASSSTSYTPSVAPSASSSTTKIYAPYQQSQHAPQPMEGVEPTYPTAATPYPSGHHEKYEKH